MLKKSLTKVNNNSTEALFWYVFAKSLLLFNNTANPLLALELEGLLVILQHLENTAPDYLYGGVYAVLTAIWGGRSDNIGGNRVKAETYYREARARSAGKSLIPDYVYLRYVTILDSDDTKFNQTAAKIKSFKAEDNPGFIFINKIIQEKTALLLKKKSYFF